MSQGANNSNKAAKVRDRKKNGAMCMKLTDMLAMQPASLANPRQSQPLHPHSLQSAQEEMAQAGAVADSAPPPQPLVLLAIIRTGACLSTSESVAGTGYRHDQLLSLGGVDLIHRSELSKRSSFQKRAQPKADAATKGAANSNRLLTQEPSDQLSQGEPNFRVTIVAANASLTKKHYPYLRVAQRTGGPLLSQQACGEIDQFVGTDRLLWGPAGTDFTTLRVDRPTPVCKHGLKHEHDDCRFLNAYTIKEEILVQDGQGNWVSMRCDEFSLAILGEKQTATSKTQTTKATKRKAVAVATAGMDADDNQSIVTNLVPPTPKRGKFDHTAGAPAAATATPDPIDDCPSPPSLHHRHSSDSVSVATELDRFDPVDMDLQEPAGLGDEVLELPCRVDSGFDFNQTPNDGSDVLHPSSINAAAATAAAAAAAAAAFLPHHSAPSSADFCFNFHGSQIQMPSLSRSSSTASASRVPFALHPAQELDHLGAGVVHDHFADDSHNHADTADADAFLSFFDE